MNAALLTYRLTNAIILSETTSLVPIFESNCLMVRPATGTDDNTGDNKANDCHNLYKSVPPRFLNSVLPSLL